MDFPTVDVVCHGVPGAVTPPSWEPIVDLVISSSEKGANMEAVGSQVWNIDITEDGKNPLASDSSGRAKVTAYTGKELRTYARAVDACRASITNGEILTALGILSNRLTDLAANADALAAKGKAK